MTRSVLTLAASAALLLGTTGCPLNVNGNAKSGKDKSYKAGKKIELEDVGGGTFEGKAKGIVTYPGGDRTDWKQFEVPAGPQGQLDVEVKYKPPRKGLDVAFDVYDQYGRRRGGAKPSKKSDTKKSDTIKDVEPGLWYVRIYAATRGDAGDYRVTVAYSGKKQMIAAVDLNKLKGEIPDPPTLPAVIEPKKATPEEKAKCEVELKKCEEDKAKCEAANAAAAGGAAKPVKGRIVGSQLDSGGLVIITVDKGKKHGIDRGWTGNVLAGGNPMAGGDFNVISVKDGISVGKVKLTVDQVKANVNVIINPPAGAIVGPIACKECLACPI